MAYSPERRAAVVAKMLPPNNASLSRLSKEEGISVGTLGKWRAEARAQGQFLPDAQAGPDGWTSEDKLSAVIETAAMNETDLSAYCRQRGLYPEQIEVWRQVEGLATHRDAFRPKPNGLHVRDRSGRASHLLAMSPEPRQA